MAKDSRSTSSPERVVQDIRRKTRRRFSAEEKIRIVLEGLRGEESIAKLCRKEGLAPNLYDAGAWSFWKPARSGSLAIRRAKSRPPNISTRARAPCRRRPREPDPRS